MLEYSIKIEALHMKSMESQFDTNVKYLVLKFENLFPDLKKILLLFGIVFVVIQVNFHKYLQFTFNIFSLHVLIHSFIYITLC